MKSYTEYPNPAAVIADIRRIARKTGQARIADELIDDIHEGRVVAVGFGYFGERGTLIYSSDGGALHVHAVYSHDVGLDEAVAVVNEIAADKGLKYIRCQTVRAGLAYKLMKRGWCATLTKKFP